MQHTNSYHQASYTPPVAQQQYPPVQQQTQPQYQYDQYQQAPQYQQQAQYAQQPQYQQQASTTSVQHQQTSTSHQASVQSVFTQYTAQYSTLKFQTPSQRILSVHQKAGEKVWLKIGCMIAYTGDYSFTREGIAEHGLLKSLKEGITGEGMTLIKATCKKDGILFGADEGKKVINIYLNSGDQVVVNGDDVLCFEESVKWDIKFMKSISGIVQGGLFNVSLKGPGFISVTTHFDPLVLWVQPNLRLLH